MSIDPKLLAEAFGDTILVRFPGGDGFDRALIEAYRIDVEYAKLLIEALQAAVDKIETAAGMITPR